MSGKWARDLLGTPEYKATSGYLRASRAAENQQDWEFQRAVLSYVPMVYREFLLRQRKKLFLAQILPMLVPVVVALVSVILYCAKVIDENTAVFVAAGGAAIFLAAYTVYMFCTLLMCREWHMFVKWCKRQEGDLYAMMRNPNRRIDDIPGYWGLCERIRKVTGDS